MYSWCEFELHNALLMYLCSDLWNVKYMRWSIKWKLCSAHFVTQINAYLLCQNKFSLYSVMSPVAHHDMNITWLNMWWKLIQERIATARITFTQWKITYHMRRQPFYIGKIPLHLPVSDGGKVAKVARMWHEHPGFECRKKEMKLRYYTVVPQWYYQWYIRSTIVVLHEYISGATCSTMVVPLKCNLERCWGASITILGTRDAILWCTEGTQKAILQYIIIASFFLELLS